jgi:hypothetical protein
MVDTTALSQDASRITLSDGTSIDLPGILILDRADHSRQIVFDPEPEQASVLWKGDFTVHRIGTSCSDAEDCRPLLLWAVAGVGKALP